MTESRSRFKEVLDGYVFRGVITMETAGQIMDEMFRDTEELNIGMGYSQISEEMSFDNFFWNKNESAHGLLRSIAFIPRVRQIASPVVIHGGTGNGKTHLLGAIARSCPKSRYISTDALISLYKCSAEDHSENDLIKRITDTSLLLVDDLHAARYEKDVQAFMIRIADRMRLKNGAIVASCRITGESIKFIKRIFLEKAGSGVQVELRELDRESRLALLERFFSRTGYSPQHDVCEFLADKYAENNRTLLAAAKAVRIEMLNMSSGVPFKLHNAVEALIRNGISFASTDLVKSRDSREKYRILLRQASSTQEQISTLIMAAENRLKELENRGVPPEEKTKLLMALDFLRKGELKNAMIQLNN
ncbi:hypothetical protein CSA37_01155 [Candidatus Fermentibacteria bacterium]|nr:MAG: hypothetical protein CSA37_01155 [Candidatus Fermentibacteria bacterium]